MGRYLSDASQGGAGTVRPSEINPVTGTFGTGNVRVYGNPGTATFTVPDGITAVRARCFGGGATASSSYGGGGGGFALKVITGLTPGDSITVTVGGIGGSSSFGVHVSATGASTFNPGNGVGGDINALGGTGGQEAGSGGGGGGVGSVFGKGGDGGGSGSLSGKAGGSGGGGVSAAGGAGIGGQGGESQQSTTAATSGRTVSVFSLDLLGTGGGGGGGSTSAGSGVNGGGGGGGNNSGGAGGAGGFPGGGGGGRATNNFGVGAPGLVLVEW